MDVEREVAERRLPPPADRKALRESAGLTVIEVAEALEVSRMSVYAWERDPGHRDYREPRGDYRKRYARLLVDARRALATAEFIDA